MISRLILFGVAALASASPITLTFTGTADGVLGSTSFTQADFTLVFNSDTDLVMQPVSVPEDWSTPSGTPATFMILISPTMMLSGSFTDDQAVFAHPDPEDDIGIWHFASPDWLAKKNTVFGTYDLKSSLGPISDGVNAWPGIFPNPEVPGSSDAGFSTTLGNFVLSDVSALTFTADVAAPGSDATPEPSTATFLWIGIGGLVVGNLFRKRSA